jgi:hypothetical protein
MRRLAIFTLLLIELSWASASGAQPAAAEPESETAVCTFGDGQQLSVRYRPIATRGAAPPAGKAWMPGGSAVTLFAETEVTLGSTSIPTGAYTMYFIPGKKEWTLIVSRNVKVESPYDEKQDLARASMETGALSQPQERLKIFFGRTGPKQCEINVDYGKTRAWVVLKQK